MNDSREPSVPPRMLVFTGVRPARRIASMALSMICGVTVDHLLHVAVLLLDLQPVGRAREVLHHVFDDAFQQGFLLLQALHR